ncbi:hypothetical protein [Hafnia alvei]|mgnify:CR=1 FL=1|uniref:Uncharacterized protein n=1 Tax=Hafnia alvei TaxID=569 RepID=A0A1C6YXT3_HAFAL|nr:hypothetical protein [Hafnia alvei]NLS53333.1 hypothetical protein [Hafnia alvei]SCM51678.1 hypothetical protein BN1044_01146 [Hafnia alvei]
MSVKLEFFKKLQARQPEPASAISKSQADIVEFRLRMVQLQEQIDVWLMGTGLTLEMLTTSVTDLLVEGGAFDISGSILRYDDRSVKFMPIFLYGHGVAGCMEVSLCFDGKVIPQRRLFMRAGTHTHWTCTSKGALSLPNRMFDEDAFFEMVDGLLS